MSSTFPYPPLYYQAFENDDFTLEPPVNNDNYAEVFHQQFPTFPASPYYLNFQCKKNFDDSKFQTNPGSIKIEFLKLLKETMSIYMKLLKSFAMNPSQSNSFDESPMLLNNLKNMLFLTNVMRQAEGREIIISQLKQEIQEKKDILCKIDESIENVKVYINSAEKNFDEYLHSLQSVSQNHNTSNSVPNSISNSISNSLPNSTNSHDMNEINNTNNYNGFYQDNSSISSIHLQKMSSVSNFLTLTDLPMLSPSGYGDLMLTPIGSIASNGSTQLDGTTLHIYSDTSVSETSSTKNQLNTTLYSLLESIYDQIKEIQSFI